MCVTGVTHTAPLVFPGRPWDRLRGKGRQSAEGHTRPEQCPSVGRTCSSCPSSTPTPSVDPTAPPLTLASAL